MADWKLELDAFKARFACRFATKASRFRCAVGAGLAMTTVGVLTVGAGTAGFADDLFGALGSIFQMQPAAPQYSEQSSVGYAATRTRAVRRQRTVLVRPVLARRRADEAKPQVRLALHHDKSVRLGHQSMCVRLCDGFAFPIGTYLGEEDRPAHEATCQSECPGARTALYVLPNGSDKISDLVDAKSGRNYSQMPTAFHYTTVLHDACTCHPAEGNRISSLLHDFTLRRGDAVMTKTGFRVFHGGDHFPHRQGDFITLAHSRDVEHGRRDTFHAIERASLGSKSNVVQARPPATAAAVPAPFQKQASLAP